MHVANVAAPFVPLHDHSPGAGLEVAALDRLTDVCAALRRGYTPMQTVSAFLEVECRRIPADRNARMVDGGDEVVELCTSKRSGFDDLPPSAHVPRLHAVGDAAADLLSLDRQGGRVAFLELAGLGSFAAHVLIASTSPLVLCGSSASSGRVIRNSSSVSKISALLPSEKRTVRCLGRSTPTFTTLGGFAAIVRIASATSSSRRLRGSTGT